MKKILLFVFVVASSYADAQHVIKGKVVETAGDSESSMPGVNIYFVNSNVAVFTDSAGRFAIIADTLPIKIVASFIGYNPDTLDVISEIQPVKIKLRKSIDLKEVNVGARRDAINISTIRPVNAETITQGELLKAACCNLSEAFETNPSVNVAYKDAVTGVKEIQLLGLGGIYVQMQSENIPDMRGLAGVYGLTYVPGPWIESLQLTKGSGSVLNGYESTTGQINVEYKKPFDKEQPRFYLNLFGDERGAVEANSIIKHKINEKWSTMLMLHGRSMQLETDRNHDGFMDIPNDKLLNIYSRWNYHDERKLESQLNIKFLSDQINGGQISDLNFTPLYKTNVKTNRAEVSGKLGFIFPGKPFKSIGNIFEVSVHDMKSSFGIRTYNANEKSIYLQSIYQNILFKSNHLYRAGFTFRHNNLEQQFPGIRQRTEENIPGAFLEYTYSHLDKLTVIAGLREDLLPENKWLFTPRLHGKYNFTESFIFRFSGGKSYRTPYLIADHLSVLASSRAIDIRETIKPEEAWNYGINFTRKFEIPHHEISFSTDVYRTDFIEQLVVDTYSDSTKISFYNLTGKSYSNSIQLTLNIELTETMTFRAAWKNDDVRSTFNGKTERQPLVTASRLLGTMSWATEDQHWKADLTAVWEGKKKLQHISGDFENGGKDYSPSFSVMNFQLTKAFRKFEVYSGAENIFDFRQKDPIVHPENPFGTSFDATNIWGPIAGRRIYAGVRYSIR